ncbi:hypothetical protein [Sandarakinorhabdus sp.]|uniref:hypothetical protein n=1 Tax=Sandarakinorhabdus sp. TaxID=1916663 RepID=UPI003F6EB51E
MGMVAAIRQRNSQWNSPRTGWPAVAHASPHRVGFLQLMTGIIYYIYTDPNRGGLSEKWAGGNT